MKKLCLLRHAKYVQCVPLLNIHSSMYNHHFEEHGKDPMIIDAPLSELGLAQVQEKSFVEQAQGVLGEVELVVTSPLTRAVETMLAIAPPKGVCTAVYL